MTSQLHLPDLLKIDWNSPLEATLSQTVSNSVITFTFRTILVSYFLKFSTGNLFFYGSCDISVIMLFPISSFGTLSLSIMMEAAFSVVQITSSTFFR